MNIQIRKFYEYGGGLDMGNSKYKIIVKGDAHTNYPNLEELDGLGCQDEFSEYFDDDFTFKNDVSNGYMSFKFENGKLWTITEYNSNRLLTRKELEILKDYTEGQWSDGIGEGFEQYPCKYGDMHDAFGDGELTDEVYISPRHSEQQTTIEQYPLI